MPQDYEKNREIAAAFYDHSRRAVEESRYPVVEVNGSEQRGDHFGARLAHAFALAFSRGYQRVIAVGSDCPQLPDVDWDGVAKQLADGVPVLGPTVEEDGVYLIGITREQFAPSAFADLPWTTPNVLSALTEHLGGLSGHGPVFLPARGDVNGPDDLSALLGANSQHLEGLIRRLRWVLGSGTCGCRCRAAESAIRLRGRRSRAPPLGRRRISVLDRIVSLRRRA